MAAIMHLTPDMYAVSRWGGGSTTQIAIMPQDAVYADRDFLWRLSSATVELDESDFTALPDYDRLIATLSKPIDLSHDGGERMTLQPLAVHAFDGGAQTKSWGRCVDFNLMLRKGKAAGTACAVQAPAAFSPRGDVNAPEYTLYLYCIQGPVTLQQGAESLVLCPGEAAVLRSWDGTALELHGENAVCMAAEAWLC